MTKKQTSPSVVLNLETKAIYPDPHQVRKHVDDDYIKELAASLNNEQIQPIVVHPADAEGKYKIIAGECRWQAAQITGIKLKAIVREGASDEATIQALQLTENIQRSSLSPIEIAEALNTIKDKNNLKQVDLARMIGRSQGYVSSHLSLNPKKLPECILDVAESGITTDYDALNLLRRLHEENKELCEQLCSASISEGVLSRKNIQQAADNDKKIKSDILYDENKPKQGQFNSVEQAAETAHKQDLKSSGMDEQGFEYDEEDVEVLEDAPDGFDEPKKASKTAVPAGMTGGSDDDTLPGEKEDDDPLAKGWEKRAPEYASIIVNVATDTDIVKGKLVLERLDADKEYMWVQIWNAKTDKYKYERVHVENIQIKEVLA